MAAPPMPPSSGQLNEGNENVDGARGGGCGEGGAAPSGLLATVTVEPGCPEFVAGTIICAGGGT